MGFSVVALVDGSATCDDESVLGYGGIPIYLALLLYLMVGLYLVCEHHFVPSLQILGEELGLSEDAQGATVMAAGSSSPEFFTALIGVIFYASENPGPGTIVGSAIFNESVIVGVSALAAPMPLLLTKFSLYRDSGAYLFSSLVLFLAYEVITPGFVDIWESLLMMILYFGYVAIVCRKDATLRFLSRCCGPCMQIHQAFAFHQVGQDDEADQDLDTDIEIDNKSNGQNGIELRPLGAQKEEKGIKMNHLSVLRGNEGEDGIISPEGFTSPDMLLGGRRNDNLNHGSKPKVPNDEEAKEDRRNSNEDAKSVGTHGTHPDEPLTLSRLPGDPPLSPTRQMSILERRASRCGEISSAIYKYSRMPMECLFRYTIPNPEYFTFKYCFVLTFVMSIVWLALLTFLVVDLAEKLGNCMGIGEDLIGLSVLAVGSSLPDCISSVLIAMECKGDMAVCNALGSNVFDILFCLGSTFFIQSCIQKGASIKVESGTGFESLILLQFILQFLFNGILYYSNHMLQRWHGYTLLVVYAVFIAWAVIDYEVVVPLEEGSN